MSIIEVISNPRVRQWLPGILNSGMLVVLTASMAQWTWLLVKPPLPPLLFAPATTSSTANSSSVQSLLAANLFGQASQELDGRRLDNLPISSLNLVLAGVIASGTVGYALISVNGQSQEPFAVGQAVTGNAVLQAVYPDRVVIRRNGTLESLLLEGADNSQSPQEVAASRVNRPVAVSGDLVRETGPNQYMVARDQLAAQIRTPEFLKQAIIVPSGNGGFLVRQMQSGSLYEKLGLRTGDVIKNVNGKPLNSAEDALKLYQNLSSINMVQLQVMRGGRIQTLDYQLAQN